MTLKEMKDETRKKNLHYEGQDRAQKIRAFQQDWEDYLGKRSS